MCALIDLERAWKLVLLPARSMRAAERGGDADAHTGGTYHVACIFCAAGRCVLARRADPRSMHYNEMAFPVQAMEEGIQRVALIEEWCASEGYACTVYDLRDEPRAEANPFTVSPRVLDNGVLRIEFDAQGLIERIYDCENGREVLAPGEKGNQLQQFEDKPPLLGLLGHRHLLSAKRAGDYPTGLGRGGREAGPLRLTLLRAPKAPDPEADMYTRRTTRVVR